MTCVWRSQWGQTGQRRRQPVFAAWLAAAPLPQLCPRQSRWLRVWQPHVRRQRERNSVFAVHARRTCLVPTEEVLLLLQVLLRQHTAHVSIHKNTGTFGIDYLDVHECNLDEIPDEAGSYPAITLLTGGKVGYAGWRTFAFLASSSLSMTTFAARFEADGF